MKKLQIDIPGSFMYNFMEKLKVKCENKATEMAKIELSIWDQKHEDDLKKDFNFNDLSLAMRKKTLEKESKVIF